MPGWPRVGVVAQMRDGISPKVNFVATMAHASKAICMPLKSFTLATLGSHR